MQVRFGVLLYAALFLAYQAILLATGDWSVWSLPLDLSVLAIGCAYWPQLKTIKEPLEWPPPA
jgi:hypothetical protein